MKLFTELKIAGDAYPGGFATGLTMHGSATMERFSLKSGNEDLAEGITEYESDDGLSLRKQLTARCSGSRPQWSTTAAVR